LGVSDEYRDAWLSNETEAAVSKSFELVEQRL
jgi:hypothetical protein